MKKANIVLDNQSTGLTIIEKMDYDGIDSVHDALCFAFYPDGISEDEDLDDRFMALWTLFLASVGWTEDEYWKEYHSRPRHCHGCGSLMDKDGHHLDDDKTKEDQTPSENKPN